MIMEISIGVIALSFAILTIFLIKTLRTTNQTVKQLKHSLIHMEREIAAITQDSHKLIKSLNHLTTDLNEKSESLNFLFRPLAHFNEPNHHRIEHSESNNATQDKITDTIGWITSGIALYKKLKEKR